MNQNEKQRLLRSPGSSGKGTTFSKDFCTYQKVGVRNGTKRKSKYLKEMRFNLLQTQ